MEIGRQKMNKTDNIQLKGKMKLVNKEKDEQKDVFVSSCGNYDTGKDIMGNFKETGKKYNSCGGYVPPSGGGHHNSCGSVKPKPKPKPSSC